MGRLTEAIKHLLIINVIFFIATQLYGDQMYQLLSLWFPENSNFQFWQVLSHMFMHGSFMHILFNMYALWAFGSPLEQAWGRNKFLFFYFSAGLGAAALHTLANYYYTSAGFDAVSSWLSRDLYYQMLNVNSTVAGDSKMYSNVFFENAMQFLNSKGISPQFTADNYEVLWEAHASLKVPAVGASGAVYGVLVAFAFMYPNAELMLIFLPVPIKAKYFVPLIILGDVFFGISGTNTGIAHFAHIGGALIGFIMMWYWKKNQFNKNRWN